MKEECVYTHCLLIYKCKRETQSNNEMQHHTKQTNIQCVEESERAFATLNEIRKMKEIQNKNINFNGEFFRVLRRQTGNKGSMRSDYTSIGKQAAWLE